MATQNDETLNDTDKVMKFDDMVEFEVKYPEGYKKAKHFKDGQTIELHKMQAEDWASRKLGKVGKVVKPGK